MLQKITIDLSGSTGLDLHDRFGSMQTESCNEKSCIDTLTYTVTVSNAGTDMKDVTSLKMTFDGDTEDLLPKLLVNPIGAGQKTAVQTDRQIDLCSSGDYSADVDLKVECVAEGKYISETPSALPSAMPSNLPSTSRSVAPSASTSGSPTASPLSKAIGYPVQVASASSSAGDRRSLRGRRNKSK
jgi:hypothetical protein